MIGNASRSWVLAAVMLLLVSCGGDPNAGSSPTDGDSAGCADVIGGSLVPTASGFTIEATVRSADTGWEKYADAWQIRAPDGVVLGERVLTHPHVDEQPFTRSLSAVAIPPDVERVTLIAHDLVSGFCGAALELEVPHP
jgi:hypothetical protein